MILGDLGRPQGTFSLLIFQVEHMYFNIVSIKHQIDSMVLDTLRVGEHYLNFPKKMPRCCSLSTKTLFPQYSLVAVSESFLDAPSQSWSLPRYDSCAFDF